MKFSKKYQTDYDLTDKKKLLINMKVALISDSISDRKEVYMYLLKEGKVAIIDLQFKIKNVF